MVGCCFESEVYDAPDVPFHKGVEFKHLCIEPELQALKNSRDIPAIHTFRAHNPIHAILLML